jgi:hypothetical protein
VAPNDKCPSAAAAVNPLGFVQKKSDMFFLFMTSVLNLYLNLPTYSFQLSCVELELEQRKPNQIGDKINKYRTLAKK